MKPAQRIPLKKEPPLVITGPSAAFINDVLKNPKIVERCLYESKVKKIGVDEITSLSDWVQCPYDKNHRMKYSKYHQHIIRCKLQHAGVNKQPCFYNAAEIIDPKDCSKHVERCAFANNLDLPSKDLLNEGIRLNKVFPGELFEFMAGEIPEEQDAREEQSSCYSHHLPSSNGCTIVQSFSKNNPSESEKLNSNITKQVFPLDHQRLPRSMGRGTILRMFDQTNRTNIRASYDSNLFNSKFLNGMGRGSLLSRIKLD